jgi:hypothetical protein
MPALIETLEEQTSEPGALARKLDYLRRNDMSRG